MSWLQFIASLVNALAWPTLIAFVVFGFRKQFSALLRNGLKRLKAGPIELEWDLAALETRAELETSKAIEEAGEPDPLQGWLDVLQNAKQEAHAQPVLSILVAYRAVELALANALGIQTAEDSDAVELATQAAYLDMWPPQPAAPSKTPRHAQFRAP